MKIAIRGGHSPNCKGAIGIVDEQIICLDVANRVGSVLEKYGHTVFYCSSTEKTQIADLQYGVGRANSNNADIYVSIHANAYDNVPKQGYGTEAWIYSEDSGCRDIAKRFCNNFCNLGFYNRGVKTSKGLYELRETNMSAVLVELFFVDESGDVAIYNNTPITDLVYSIANAIDEAIPVKPPVAPTPQPVTDTFFRVIVGSYKDRNNALAKKDELVNKGYTDTFIDIYKPQ